MNPADGRLPAVRRPVTDTRAGDGAGRPHPGSVSRHAPADPLPAVQASRQPRRIRMPAPGLARDM